MWCMCGLKSSCGRQMLSSLTFGEGVPPPPSPFWLYLLQYFIFMDIMKLGSNSKFKQTNKKKQLAAFPLSLVIEKGVYLANETTGYPFKVILLFWCLICWLSL